MQKKTLYFFILFLLSGSSVLPRHGGADAVSHLAPQTRVPKKPPFVCPTHRGINFFIEQYLEEKFGASRFGCLVKFQPLPAYGQKAHVIPVPKLFRFTGQLYHLGLGRTHGKAVIYVDENFKKNPAVLKHALFVLSQWEGLRLELGISPYHMRLWVQMHLEQARKLAAQWNAEADRHHDLRELLNPNGVDHAQVQGFAVPFPDPYPDLVVGFGMQNMDTYLLAPPSEVKETPSRFLEILSRINGNGVELNTRLRLPGNEIKSLPQGTRLARYDGLEIRVFPICGLFEHTGWIAQFGWGREGNSLLLYVDESASHDLTLLVYCYIHLFHWEKARIAQALNNLNVWNWILNHFELAEETMWRLHKKTLFLKMRIEKLELHGVPLKPELIIGRCQPFADFYELPMKNGNGNGKKKRQMLPSVILGIVVDTEAVEGCA